MNESMALRRARVQACTSPYVAGLIRQLHDIDQQLVEARQARNAAVSEYQQKSFDLQALGFGGLFELADPGAQDGLHQKNLDALEVKRSAVMDLLCAACPTCEPCRPAKPKGCGCTSCHGGKTCGTVQTKSLSGYVTKAVSSTATPTGLHALKSHGTKRLSKRLLHLSDLRRRNLAVADILSHPRLESWR